MFNKFIESFYNSALRISNDPEFIDQSRNGGACENVTSRVPAEPDVYHQAGSGVMCWNINVFNTQLLEILHSCTRAGNGSYQQPK